MKQLFRIFHFYIIIISFISAHKSKQIPLLFQSKGQVPPFQRKLSFFNQDHQQNNQNSPNNQNNCPCLTEAQKKCPPCNPYEFSPAPDLSFCPCAPKELCPPCILAKTQKFLHEQAEKEVSSLFFIMILTSYRRI